MTDEPHSLPQPDRTSVAYLTYETETGRCHGSGSCARWLVKRQALAAGRAAIETEREYDANKVRIDLATLAVVELSATEAEKIAFLVFDAVSGEVLRRDVCPRWLLPQSTEQHGVMEIGWDVARFGTHVNDDRTVAQLPEEHRA
jgi:hypothetical protein